MDKQPLSSVLSLQPVGCGSFIEGAKPEASHLVRQRREGSSPRISKGSSADGEQVKKWKRYQGWRMSVCLCAACAGLVLLINFVLTIWASLWYHTAGGLATVQEGSCQKTKRMSQWLHFAINALSTALLSASNYCMQCLSSPTREEVDNAHRKRMWLDIGVPSLRNLRQIPWVLVVLWWALALSSIPLHLLYNSAVFSCLATTQYMVYAASPDFLTSESVAWSQTIHGAA